MKDIISPLPTKQLYKQQLDRGQITARALSSIFSEYEKPKEVRIKHDKEVINKQKTYERGVVVHVSEVIYSRTPQPDSVQEVNTPTVLEPQNIQSPITDSYTIVKPVNLKKFERNLLAREIRKYRNSKRKSEKAAIESLVRRHVGIDGITLEGKIKDEKLDELKNGYLKDKPELLALVEKRKALVGENNKIFKQLRERTAASVMKNREMADIVTHPVPIETTRQGILSPDLSSEMPTMVTKTTESHGDTHTEHMTKLAIVRALNEIALTTDLPTDTPLTNEIVLSPVDSKAISKVQLLDLVSTGNNWAMPDKKARISKLKKLRVPSIAAMLLSIWLVGSGKAPSPEEVRQFVSDTRNAITVLTETPFNRDIGITVPDVQTDGSKKSQDKSTDTGIMAKLFNRRSVKK